MNIFLILIKKMGRQLLDQKLVQQIKNLRPILMTIDDIKEISEIFISFWGDQGLYSEKTFINIINQELSYVYKLNGQIIAYCLVEYNNDKRIAEIALLCVRKGFQGYHLGQNILKYSIEKCEEIGITNFGLHVSTTNTRAFNLYKKLGFLIQNFIPKYYDDEEPEDSDAYYMTLVY